MMDDDATLVFRAVRGDEVAFEAIYARYNRPVHEYAWRMTGRSSVAEEIVQECFLAFFKLAPRYDASRARVLTLLLTIARNHVVKRQQTVMAETTNDVVAVAASVEEDLLADERAVAVRRAIARLPESQREVLVLFEFEDLSMKEIGAILGLDAGAVKSRLFRARESLKRWLAPHALEVTP